MAKLLKQILPTIFPQHDWRWHLLSNWKEVVGPLHAHMRLEKIDNDVIIIGVYDSHWMHELYMLSNNLLHTINAQLDKPYVNHIRFSLVTPRRSLSSIKTKH